MPRNSQIRRSRGLIPLFKRFYRFWSRPALVFGSSVILIKISDA
jgi:hypothetical protein